MPKWAATLNGDPWDLKTLAGRGVGVSEEGDSFVLRSPEFDSLIDANAVRDLAIQRVEVLNGLGRMVTRDFRPVTVGGVGGSDESGIWVMPAPADVRVDARGPSVVISDSVTGEPMPSAPPSHFAKWVAIADRVPSIRQALSFFGAPGPVTAVDLFKVYEVIREDVGGGDKRLGASRIVSNGWATADEIDGFRSVHYPSTLGENARHGVEPKPQPAPLHPMSLVEAQAFITRLLERWLSSK